MQCQSRRGPTCSHTHIFEDGDMGIQSNCDYNIANIFKDLNSHIMVKKFIIAIPLKKLEATSRRFEKQD